MADFTIHEIYGYIFKSAIYADFFVCKYNGLRRYNMIILDVNKVSKNFGFGELFHDVSFSLNEGESISIVGPNGSGKSTLMKIIAGIERLDSGTVSIKKDIEVGYLDQTSADKIDNRSVRNILSSVFGKLQEMKERLLKYEERLKLESDNEALLLKYCKLVEEFSSSGGYDIDVQVNTVCTGLGISLEMLDRIYSTLSGGEKTLVQLASVLLLKPALLLLDEPTNHLDIERIEWLEEYIKSFKGASVIISHDRYFLDRMSNKILDITDTCAKVYSTNYSGYLKQREEEFEKQMASYKDQQIIIKRFKEQIKYFAERGMATNSSTMCNRAHALQTMLDRILKNKINRPQEQKEYNLSFRQEKKASTRVMEARKLSVSVPNGKVILKNIDLVIQSKERVALIGNNGSGKSTFIKTMLGINNGLEVSGETIISPSTKIGYLPQIIDFSNENHTVFEYFKGEIMKNEEQARSLLFSFGFNFQDSNKLVENLSGGERIRLRLAILLEQKVNCLIFDEPTNHIDIQTKETLEKALQNFGGTFIFVSHDRYFINKFAKKIVEFNNGEIMTFDGNYEYYKKNKMVRKKL